MGDKIRKLFEKILYFYDRAGEIMVKKYLGLLLKKMGRGCSFNKKISIVHPQNLEVGDFVSMGEGVYIAGYGRITIEDYVIISAYSRIMSSKLDVSQPYKDRKHINEPIAIGKGVWIGMGATVLGG